MLSISLKLLIYLQIYDNRSILNNMEYLYSFSLLLILTISILTCIFVKAKKIISILIYLIALILLIWKIIEFSYYAYIQNGTYPIEISHISYFLYGSVFVLGIKKLYYTAGFFALISGIGYVFAGVVSPTSVINFLPTYLFIMGIMSHSLLLFGGMLVIFNYQKYSYKNLYFPYIFLSFALLFAYLVSIKVFYPLASGLDNMFVIKLVKGNILSYFNMTSSNEINIFISVLVVIIICLLIFLFNFINNKIYKKREENTYDFSILSFIKQINKQSK